MSTRSPHGQYSPEPNTLEVRAGRYLQGLAPSASAAARELSEEEARTLEAVTRRSVGWAGGAGIISGALIGALEIFVRRELMNGAEGMDWSAQLPYWAGFFAVAGVVSAVEIAFLYWNGLRAVGRVTRLGRVGLAGGEHRELLARGLARAALEFPNPGTRVFGVDPYQRVSEWRLTLKNLLYKTKVGVSSFILRVSLRRVVGRMAVRGILPLLAAPLYAVWNAIITWRLLQTARLRALAPGVIEERVRALTEGAGAPAPEAREAVLAGVAEVMVRARDAHPNYVYYLSRLLEVSGMEGEEVRVEWDAARARLGEMGEGERELALDALVVAALVADRIRDDQVELLEEAHEAAGVSFRGQALSRLQKQVIGGRGLSTDDLRSVRS